eukprot:1163914-Amphidinium_carterae.2
MSSRLECRDEVISRGVPFQQGLRFKRAKTTRNTEEETWFQTVCVRMADFVCIGCGPFLYFVPDALLSIVAKTCKTCLLRRVPECRERIESMTERRKQGGLIEAPSINLFLSSGFLLLVV